MAKKMKEKYFYNNSYITVNNFTLTWLHLYPSQCKISKTVIGEFQIVLRTYYVKKCN